MAPVPAVLLERAGTGSIVALIVAGSLWLGFELWTVSITIGQRTLELIFFEGTLTVAGFTLFSLVSGTILLREIWQRPTTGGQHGPPVRVLIPAYRDGDVLCQSVESVLESEYEPLRLSIAVEPNDRQTRRRAKQLADEYDPVSVLTNQRPGSKAGAINDAVARCPESYFAVFDADEQVNKQFLPTAMSTLVAGADVYQGRRIPRPTGAIETIAYCERVLVHAAYALFDPLGFPNSRSASTAFNREAFEAVGGYNRMLTEDLSFAHECHEAGLTVEHDRSCTNTMEAPHTLRDFWGQRKRWRMGQIQVFHSLLGPLVHDRPGRRDVVPFGRAVGSILGGLLTLTCASHLLLLAVLDPSPLLFVPVALVYGTITGAWLRDYLAGRIGQLSWTVLAGAVVYPLLGVLTVKSVLAYALTWDGEWYTVTKDGS